MKRAAIPLVLGTVVIALIVLGPAIISIMINLRH
jgi:hypothetical protein